MCSYPHRPFQLSFSLILTSSWSAPRFCLRWKLVNWRPESTMPAEVSTSSAWVSSYYLSWYQLTIERGIRLFQTTLKRGHRLWLASSLLLSAPCLVDGSSWSRLLKVWEQIVHKPQFLLLFQPFSWLVKWRGICHFHTFFTVSFITHSGQ